MKNDKWVDPVLNEVYHSVPYVMTLHWTGTPKNGVVILDERVPAGVAYYFRAEDQTEIRFQTSKKRGRRFAYGIATVEWWDAFDQQLYGNILKRRPFIYRTRRNPKKTHLLRAGDILRVRIECPHYKGELVRVRAIIRCLRMIRLR